MKLVDFCLRIVHYLVKKTIIEILILLNIKKITIMNKKIEKDLISARYLNGHLFIPSNCYEYSNIPEVRYIICGDDVCSREIGAQMVEAVRKNYGFLPKLICGSDFKILDANGEISSVQSLDLIHDIESVEIVPEKTLIITRKAAYNKLEDVSEFSDTYFCIREYLMDYRLERNFILKPSIHNQGWGEKWLKNYDNILLYDDDVTISFEGVGVFLKMLRLFGINGPSGKSRKLFGWGGKGPMSKWLLPNLMKKLPEQTEAQLHAYTAELLGIPEEYVEALPGGDNTGENLRIAESHLKGKTLVIVSQRLSLVLKYSAQMQAPGLELDYYVIYEKVNQVMKWVNGMKLAQGRPILHFFGDLLKRWQKYSKPNAKGEVFMTPVFGVDEVLQTVADSLLKYEIKQQTNSLKMFGQYVPILISLFLNRSKIQEEYLRMSIKYKSIYNAEYGKQLEQLKD